MAVAKVASHSLAELVSLKGRTAMATGAACGLGKATARRLAEAGASVLIGDIDAESAAKRAAELSQVSGSRVISAYSDAGNSASVLGLVETAVRELGRTDIVRSGYNPLFMHPDDFAHAGLFTGAMVELKTRHGGAIGFVEADADMRPGVVAMTRGFGARHRVAYDPRRVGTNVNQLLSWEDDYEPYHGMSRMGAVPIAVPPVPARASTQS